MSLRRYSVVVITPDSESGNDGSNPSTGSLLALIFYLAHLLALVFYLAHRPGFGPWGLEEQSTLPWGCRGSPKVIRALPAFIWPAGTTASLPLSLTHPHLLCKLYHPCLPLPTLNNRSTPFPLNQETS